ncbi:basic helix-loop-helix domain-containing protein USF3 isoform X1 [Alosa pseudoharengus]|uniref:basic helix-loop-helix domain-containing protein USF3 isoform X1 n=1 Tax=Alosa pseudoharengus TaxID=34774 RepID=UPI003F899BB3
MPEITQSQTPVHKSPSRRKKNKNKESHNAVERHRKEKINAGINRIGDLLPCSPALKQSKNMILSEAHRYITELKQQSDEMLLTGGDKGQAEEIKRLRRQVEDLRKESAHYLELLKANGINFLDDPTIHWKGKQRSAKVAKVTPTHLLSKGIIVYSSGNTTSPSGKQPGQQNLIPQQDKQPETAVIVERACDVRPVVHNGAPVHDVIPSSTPQHIPVATLIPAVTRIGLAVVEQPAAVAPVAPKLPPPVNYITFQSLCPQPAVTAHLPQQPLPVSPASTLTSGTISTVFPRQGVTHLSRGADSRLLAPDVAVMVTSSNQTLPSSSNLLSAAGNTQTTWTTLHLAGNTVQPVCQSLPTSVSNGGNSAGPQQFSVCSVGVKPSTQPTTIQIQQQAVAMPHVAFSTSLPLQPSQQQQPQLQPQSAILPQSTLLTHPVSVSQGQPVILPQSTLGPHSQVTVLSQPTMQPVAQPQPALISVGQPKPVLLPQTKPQPALLPQPQLAVMPQSAVISQQQSVAPPQPQPALLPQPQPSVVAQPQSAILPQAQPGLNQRQAAVVPMLQTMQVLQVNPAGTTVAAVPVQQNNNPNVVILQQAGSCTAQQVMREDLSSQTTQTPCQHIVIIQAPNQTPQTPQTPQTVVPAAMPVLPGNITTSNALSVNNNQAVSGKQLVHILPQLSSQAPQTISMNGQVFVLQPVQSPDKGSGLAAPVPQQISQTSSGEEQSGSLTVHSLGSLTSLNQTDSQVTSQSIVQVHTIAPPSHAVVQHNLPTTNLAVNSSGTMAPTSTETPAQPKQVSSEVKGPVKKIGPCRKPGRKPKSARSKDLKLGRCLLPIAAKPTTQQTKPFDSVQLLKQSTAAVIAPKTTSSSKRTVTVSCTNTVQTTRAVTKNSPTVMKSPVTRVNLTASGVLSTSASSSQNTPSISVAVSEAVVTVTSIQSTLDKSTVASPVTNCNGVSTTLSVPSATPVSSAPSRTMATSISFTQETIPVSKQTAKLSRSAAATNSCSLNTSIDNGLLMTKDTTAVSCVDSIVKPLCSAVSVQPVSRESPQTKTVCVGLSVPSIPSATSYSSMETTALVTCVGSTHSKSTVVPSSGVMVTPIPTIQTSAPSRPAISVQSNQPPLQCHKTANLLDSSQICRSSTLPSIQTSCAEPSLQSTPSATASQMQPPEPRKRDNTSGSRSQPQEVSLAPLPSTQMSSAELKLDSRKEKALVSIEKGHLLTDRCPRKDSSHPQEVYALEQDSLEQPLISNSQTDLPLSAGGRGFSVASMLPTGHSTSASSNSFGTFSFTPEQAEILALVTAWDLPKSQQAPNSKERNPEQQFKPSKHLDLPLIKTSSQSSVRCPPVEGTTSRPNRPPHSVAYSQSQSASVGSLNVNNLIRPSSSQPYPGSPSLAQQASIPSPGGPANLVSQPSTPVLPNCSVSGQLNEYTPLKSMRPHGGGVAERHLKELPKRPAQDDVMLPSNKRPKGCPPGNVGRMDVKTADHSQMIIGQMTPISSAVMTRINPESSLFSSNGFMSTVLRPTDGHCTSQVLSQEPNQPGVVHLQPSHSQNSAQSQQHIGGNPYLKHQQQEQQRHHLYQLQHHLTQSDNTQGQLHNIHQRTMQQDQHVHKKRGMVRGGQTGPPVGMQQKQHHLEKSGLQQHPPSQQHQQHQQQQHQQQQQQQQQAHQQQQQQAHQQHQQQQLQQHQQQHHHQQQQQQSQQLQQAQHQQPHQQQQQQIQQQSSHSRHQHLQQQIQQQHFGGRLQEKTCEAQPTGPRTHQNSHMGQQECQSGQDHNTVQRLMGSRSLEQQLTSQANSSASRSSDLTCAPSRHERQRLSSYSAEALIGKSSSSGEQRMGLHLQAPRGNNQDQPDLRYLERGKGNINHNPANRLPPDHPGPADVQRINECPPFKTLSSSHQLGNFEVQVSRAGDTNKTVPPAQRGPQVQGTFRMGPSSGGDGRSRVPYSSTHAGPQGMQIGVGQEACQSFMQSLLAPHLPEQTGHQRSQCCPPVSIEYSCVPGTSAGDLQAKASSPSLSSSQKAPAMRLGESNKGHIPQVSGNLHGQGVRTGLPHLPTPQSNTEPGRNSAPSRPLTAVSQRTRHIGQEAQSSKIRPGERQRSGNVRTSDPFESEGSLTLPSTGGVILGRPQTGAETRRGSIVRFMPDSSQVSSENNLVSDQHLSQNFPSFPFIADGSMNPPPPINANSTFIPPVSQSGTSRTPALLPVEPQNTLPSFYPSYSPAAHPSLPSELPIQYFSNQMFTSPSTDKSSTAPLNNRFSSILSPPRPVGFAQASFPLLPEMPPMPIGNSSSITPHLPNFNLTSLFPEIATAMPPDGSSMPMSPLLSLANTSSTDSSKQTNRPAHNISHILGHDGSSAV